jgi:glyoxylase-like metal-dependent hydrolase (beta-lactamase superfamily II)
MIYHVLSLTKDLGFTQSVIHPVIIESDIGLILFDAGYPGQRDDFEQAVKNLGFSLSDLRVIVVSHHDHDHVGSLKALSGNNPALTVISSVAESEYISGKKTSLRLIQAESYNAGLQGDAKVFGERFAQYLKTIEPVPVTKTVTGDEYICAGLRVIDTHGHTPGHLSLYLENEKILFAGDALAVEHDAFVIPNPQFTLDWEGSVASVRKIKELDVNKIICYHGGEYRGTIRTGLEKLEQNSRS